MPNEVTALGLTTKTQAELITQFSDAYKAIYGTDINLEPSTPDAQMMMIYIQAVLDVQDLIRQVFNGFDPDNAIGNVLDQRVTINGIQRQAGTYTTTNITIVTSQALNLFGLDQDAQDVYTVADNAGTQWQLIATNNIAGPGTYVMAFRAALPGATLTTPNTIKVPVTIVLGVVSINNPTTYTTLGINEETDFNLKIRRQKSVSLASQGYLSGLLAALENINGVVAANVYENFTDTVNADGVPGHSIWVVVSGTAAPAEIAQAIYTKRNAGCGMFGSQTYTITQVDGTAFIVQWDNVVAENLFIKFTASSLDGINPPNIAAIRAQLPAIYIPGINEKVNINDLATLVQQIDPNTLVTNAGFSTTSGGSYTSTLSPSAKNKQFVVSSPDIIVIPMIMSPSSAQVATLGTKQFTALGGYGAITWTMDANPSGGSVDSSGLYTAGGTPTTTDVVRATDTQGNFVTANVTVV